VSIADWELTLLGEGDITSLNTYDITVETTDLSVENRNWKKPYRMGFNTIRTSEMKTVGTNIAELDTISEVFNDIAAVGGQGARHFKAYDFSWFSGGVYESGTDMSKSENYDFSGRNDVFKNKNGVYSIPTLYAVGPSSMARYLGYVSPSTCEELFSYAEENVGWFSDARLSAKEKEELTAEYCDEDGSIKTIEISAEKLWEKIMDEMLLVNIKGELYSPYCSDGGHKWNSPEGYCATAYTPDRE